MAPALGAFALFAALGVLVHSEPALWIDRAAFDVIDPLRGAAGLDIVRVLTDVGSLPVAALVTGGAAFRAARTHGTATAVALCAALLLAFAFVHLGKDLTDRPRPDTRFYEPGGLAYPSGHSAYATAWLAAAALAGRRGLIVAAAILVLAIGLSRLYLHVHHLTDVVGGFAVGAAVYLPVLARR